MWRSSCVALILATLAACAPKPPPGPQPTGASSRAFVGDTELAVSSRYQAKGNALTLFVDLGAQGGPLDVSVRVEADGAHVEGQDSWSGQVPAGATTTFEAQLAMDAKTASVMVISQGDDGRELSRDELKFLVDEDEGLRECRADDPC